MTSASFKKQKLNTSDDILDFDYPHFDSPELSIESKETSEKIKEFISNLPEILKTPFILREYEYEGKSYQEIANIIDCPVGTVRSRIFRARESILDFMEAQKKSFKGNELKGKTLGIIGLGSIGSLLAQTAEVMGMKIIGYDPYISIDAAWRLPKDVEKADSMKMLLS